MKRTKLTMKQEKFAREYINNGGNGTQAALKVYDTDKANVADVIAVENLQKPNVAAKIKSLQAQFVDDSYTVYNIQKALLHKTKDNEKHFELANKIANKILDRAGFMPVAKSENKSITAKFIINRGEDNQTTS